jgi:hypothetical protein
MGIYIGSVINRRIDYLFIIEKEYDNEYIIFICNYSTHHDGHHFLH